MGAVFPFQILVMAQICMRPVYIVVSEWHLPILIKAIRCDLSCIFFDIQLIQMRLNFLRIQQIKLLDVILNAHIRPAGLQGKGILKACCGKADMIQVQACVYDGNPGTRTGITGCIGRRATNLLR